MTVVQSYGLGADSSAILFEWMRNPSSRDFELEDLVVVTAMTGDEFIDTRVAVENEMLPRMAAHGIRYVQVARGGPLVGDGVVTLDDSRRPTQLFADGVFRLADEMFAGGTVPQVASGRRTCSIKQKGVPLDTWIGENIDGPFRHVMGFNADEQKRADRDSSYSNEERASEYPLIEWGWGRDRLLEEIEKVVGMGKPWPKSCCSYCPFANDNHLSRYVEQPEAAVQAMLMEHVSMALNPRMTLFASKSVQRLVADALPDIADRFYGQLAGTEHAVYDIRRVFHARKADPTMKGIANRSVRKVATGSFATCSAILREHAAALGGERPAVEDGILRSWIDRQRTDRYPTTERFLVVAPNLANEKEQRSFDKWWASYRAA